MVMLKQSAINLIRKFMNKSYCLCVHSFPLRNQNFGQCLSKSPPAVWQVNDGNDEIICYKFD